MKVKELIKQLQELPQEDDIVITAMDDHFFETEFEVHSPYEDGQAQEIIINTYFKQHCHEYLDEKYEIEKDQRKLQDHAEKVFVEIAEQYGTYDEIKEHIRSLHSADELTDEEYNYILEEWDNILKKNNL